MESDHLQQFLAEIEERICTCGAGHGSGEGHTDWCEWVEVYSCPPAPEEQQERPSEQAVTEAMVRAAAEILIGRVNAPEQEIYTAARDALKAAMEASDERS